MGVLRKNSVAFECRVGCKGKVQTSLLPGSQGGTILDTVVQQGSQTLKRMRSILPNPERAPTGRCITPSSRSPKPVLTTTIRVSLRKLVNLFASNYCWSCCVVADLRASSWSIMKRPPGWPATSSNLSTTPPTDCSSSICSATNHIRK